jgi:DNA-binding MarR family transcriptional regulator
MSGREGAPGERLVRQLLRYAALLRRIEHKLARELKLRRSDLRCLEEFALQQDIPIKALTHRLGVSGSHVSHLLDRLEGMRLIKRRINPEDRRVVVVSRTVRGEKALEQLYRRLYSLHAVAWSGLEESRIEASTVVLETVNRHLGSLVERSEAGCGSDFGSGGRE